MQKMRLLASFFYFLFFIFLMGCLSVSSGDLDEEGGEDESSVLSSILEPSGKLSTKKSSSLFDTPRSLHIPYEMVANLPRNQSPLLVCSVLQIDESFSENGLGSAISQKMEELSNFEALSNGENVGLLPFSSIKKIIASSDNEYLAEENLPVAQWTAGMLGADLYLELLVKESGGSSSLKFDFFAQSVVTTSGQVVGFYEQSFEFPNILSSLQLEKRLEDAFEVFYEDSLGGTIEAAQKLFSQGRYLQLVFKSFSSTVGNKNFYEELSSCFSSEVLQVRLNDSVILGGFTLLNADEIERCIFSAGKFFLDSSQRIELIFQDSFSFVYEVEAFNYYEK